MSFDSRPQFFLRLAGIAYLANICLGLFGEAYVRGTLVVAGDALATATNIANVPGLWRAGIAGDLLMQLLDIPLIVLFYLLLRPVSRPLALTATLFNIVQTAVLVINKLSLLAPLLLSAEALGSAPIPDPLLVSLTAFAINMHGHGFGIGLIFFGFACLVRGYLIARSGFMPPVLGHLLVTAGLAYLVNSFALLLAPDLAQQLFPWILLPSLVAELALSLWLLVRGVDAEAWQQRLLRFKRDQQAMT